jgi:DNA-binding Lrp family transcriptional regulator
MITAIVLLTMLGGTGESLGWAKETKNRLSQISGVKRVYGVFGRYDLVAILEAENFESLTSLIADKIRSVPGIQASETLTVAF